MGLLGIVVEEQLEHLPVVPNPWILKYQYLSSLLPWTPAEVEDQNGLVRIRKMPLNISIVFAKTWRKSMQEFTVKTEIFQNGRGNSCPCQEGHFKVPHQRLHGPLLEKEAQTTGYIFKESSVLTCYTRCRSWSMELKPACPLCKTRMADFLTSLSNHPFLCYGLERTQNCQKYVFFPLLNLMAKWGNPLFIVLLALKKYFHRMV